jgi:hypothetical protein
MKQINEIIKSQNLEVQSVKPEAEWVQSVTVLERKLLDSVGKGKAINDISIAELDKLLTILAKLVGISNSNLPDKEESLLLIRSLNRVYPNIRDEQLKIAFEMAACGQLECEEHYQSLNFKYVSSIINSYIRSVTEAKKYVKEQKMIEQPLFEPEVDWTETLEWLINEYVQGNEPIIPTAMYDWMVENKVLIIGAKEKVNAMNMGERIYKAEVQKRWQERPNSVDRAELYELEKGYDKTKPIYQRVVNEAKRYILKSYILEKKQERKKHTETDKGSAGHV